MRHCIILYLIKVLLFINCILFFKNETKVRLNDTKKGLTTLWTLEKFESRLDLMRDMYQVQYRPKKFRTLPDNIYSSRSVYERCVQTKITFTVFIHPQDNTNQPYDTLHKGSRQFSEHFRDAFMYPELFTNGVCYYLNH